MTSISYIKQIVPLTCIILSHALSLLRALREHAMLAKTAGVKHLIILVNKMDDPTVKWSEERWASQCQLSCKEVVDHTYKIQVNIYFF